MEFKLGSKSYNINCGDGEEAKIQSLAANLNNRVESLSKNFSAASDSLLIAIVALTMEDEINSLKQGVSINVSPSNEAASSDKINEAVINAIEPITEYIENLANQLETA